MPATDRDDKPDDFGRPRRRPAPAPSGSPVKPILAGVLLFLGIALGGVLFWAGSVVLNRVRQGPPPAAHDPDAKPRDVAATPPLDVEEKEAVEVFKSVKASVVNVDLVLVGKRGRFDDREQPAGTGSGFVWDTDGRVVTNFHVIAEAGKRPNIALRVVMADRTSYDARVVGTAPEYDLAVIQIQAPKEKLQPIKVGTSADLEVGMKVFAIGNPFGLSLTMTKGIISALDRTIESPANTPITGGIQHSAAINPGNSGGPLLDKAGRLIGVNTSIATPSGGNVGIGFAIPVDTVNQVVTELIQGRASKGELGIKVYTDQKKLRQLGYPTGVMIQDVTPGGPAAKAGLRGMRRNPDTGKADPGDLIQAINGEEVNGLDDYQRITAKLKPGDKVKIRYMRDEEDFDATLTVQGRKTD